MGNTKKLIVTVFLLASFAASCAPPYTMEPPKTFKRFKQINTFQFITADGVMLKGREVENYPEADLDFWQDALKRHLDRPAEKPKAALSAPTTRHQTTGGPDCVASGRRSRKKRHGTQHAAVRSFTVIRRLSLLVPSTSSLTFGGVVRLDYPAKKLVG